MSDSTIAVLVSQWFEEYHRLACWVSRRWVQRLLDHYGRSYNRSDLEELAQDGLARGFDRFAKRCAKQVCGQTQRKKWVCQCVIGGARDAVKCKSRFGSLTDAVAVRDDAMNRYGRVVPGLVHGDDDERQDALEAVSDSPVVHAVQRWELEELIHRELPDDLQATALYASVGLTQEQSALLQDVTDRTVRNRLKEIRNYLAPDWNLYGIICAALTTALADDFHRSTRRFPVFRTTFDK